jgi:hypothetical protein
MTERRKVIRKGRERVVLTEPIDRAINEVYMANQGLNYDYERDNPTFLKTYLPNYYGGQDPRKRTRGRGSQ